MSKKLKEDDDAPSYYEERIDQLIDMLDGLGNVLASVRQELKYYRDLEASSTSWTRYITWHYYEALRENSRLKANLKGHILSGQLKELEELRKKVKEYEASDSRNSIG